jgi:nitrogen fixation protein FixH
MRGKREFNLRGAHVLVGLLLFLVAIVAVNVAFAVVAVRSFPGEDVGRSYLQGLAYNDTLAERRAQAMLGWQAAAALRRGGRGAVIEVRLLTREGAPLDGATVSGELRRATTARLDRQLSFRQVGAGRYAADLGALPGGRWLLRARAANASGGALDFEADLTWRPSH